MSLLCFTMVCPVLYSILPWIDLCPMLGKISENLKHFKARCHCVLAKYFFQLLQQVPTCLQVSFSLNLAPFYYLSFSKQIKSFYRSTPVKISIMKPLATIAIRKQFIILSLYQINKKSITSALKRIKLCTHLSKKNIRKTWIPRLLKILSFSTTREQLIT